MRRSRRTRDPATNTTGHNALTAEFGVTPRTFRDVAREMCAGYAGAGARA